MDRKPLTFCQQRVLDFIVQHTEQHRFVPSRREIAAALGVRSLNTVACHLKGLTQKGYLAPADGKTRALRVLGYEPWRRDQVVTAKEIEGIRLLVEGSAANRSDATLRVAVDKLRKIEARLAAGPNAATEIGENDG